VLTIEVGACAQWKMALSLGWVPAKADRESTYNHLNAVLPDELKFDLHVLMVKYGKQFKNDVGALRSAMKVRLLSLQRREPVERKSSS
jgi:hypothetical protein